MYKIKHWAITPANCSLLVFGLTMALLLTSCMPKEDEYIWKSIEVTASAFNSVISQTDGNPSIAAWGDTLKPGMKCIAISRDLIAKGIQHNTKIKIDGIEGIFLVKDKMHFRWRNRIDIYMGTDIKKARKWGKKKMFIQYAVKKDSTNLRTEPK